MHIYIHDCIWSYLPHANYCLVNLLIYFHVLFSHGHIHIHFRRDRCLRWRGSCLAWCSWKNQANSRLTSEKSPGLVWTTIHFPWTNIATFTVLGLNVMSHFEESFYVQFWEEKPPPPLPPPPPAPARQMDWQEEIHQASTWPAGSPCAFCTASSSSISSVEMLMTLHGHRVKCFCKQATNVATAALNNIIQ